MSSFVCSLASDQSTELPAVVGYMFIMKQNPFVEIQCAENGVGCFLPGYPLKYKIKLLASSSLAIASFHGCITKGLCLFTDNAR